jgi:hypothetical protein
LAHSVGVKVSVTRPMVTQGPSRVRSATLRRADFSFTKAGNRSRSYVGPDPGQAGSANQHQIRIGNAEKDDGAPIKLLVITVGGIVEEEQVAAC